MLNKFRKCGAVFSKATASLCVAFSGSSYTLAAFGHAVAEAKESTSSEETTRIVVSTADASKVQDVAIGQYDNTYLLEYSSKEEAAKAYEEFSKDDSIQADYDYSFQVADNKSSESSSGTESSVNSLSELENVLKSNDNLEKADGKVIAVIDTKVTLDNDNIIGNVSMLGDETSTSNEHGNKVVSKILETNPDAKILAVEAIGGNGKGSLSSVYSAIEYAISQNVDIINLSISAKAKDDDIFTEAIQHAIYAGITVVGAAGNNGENVKNYVPGNNEESIIVNSCDEYGDLQSKSNYGDTIDYTIKSDSTSIAAAIASALYSKDALVVDGEVVYEAIKTKSVQETKTDEDIVKEEEKKKTNSDYTAQEQYVIDNVNSKYTKSTKLEKANAVYVKQTVVNGTKIDNEDDLDSIMSDAKKLAKCFITYEDTSVYAYNLDDDSKYYVAKINTMQDDNAEVRDVDFALTNLNGETLKDCVYDSKTGLAYIPKSHFVNAEDTEQFMNVQAQLLQVYKNKQSAKSIVSVSIDDGKKVIDKEVQLSAAEQTTKVTVASPKTVSSEKVAVKVNGAEITEAYFDEKSGELTIYQAPASIDTIEVNTNASDQEVTIATTANDMAVNPNVTVNCSDTPHAGAQTTRRLWAAYSSASQSNDYLYGISGANSYTSTLQSMANAIAKGGVDTSNLENLTTDLYWSVAFNPDAGGQGLNFTDGYGVTYECYGSGPLSLKCAHITSPNTGYVWTKAEESTTYHCCDVIVTVISVDEASSTMVLGFVTPSKNTQTGVGLYRVSYSAPKKGALKIQKSSSNKSVTNGNSNYSLEGAEYTLYTDEGCTNAIHTFKIKADGSSDEAEFDKGVYYLKETKAGAGYKLDTKVYKVTNNANQTDVIDVEDAPDVRQAYIQKTSRSTDITDGNSDYTLDGIQYTLYKTNNNGSLSDSVGVFTLDAKGTSNVLNVYMGKYYLKETKTNDSYYLTDKIYEVTVGNGVNKWTVKDYPKAAKIKVMKDSANHSITDKNRTYSLGGAIYTVYKDANCTNVVGALTTNSSGETETLTVKCGTYYVKETAAAMNYNLDATVYTVNANTSSDPSEVKTYTLNVKDEPKTVKPSTPTIETLKVDADTGKTEGQSGATLTGAEYEVKFYGNSYSTLEELNNSDATPLKTWRLKVDSSSKLLIDKEHFVSGDDLYTNTNGEVVVPSGLITYQEVKAPTGYQLNKQVYFTNIVTFENTTKLEDTPHVGKISISKTATTGAESELVAMEKNAEFTAISMKYITKYGSFDEALKHLDEYAEKEYSVMTTDEEGNAASGDLAYGAYIVKQTKVGQSTADEEKELDICEQEASVFIDENEEDSTPHHLTFNNISTKYSIKIVKVDAETGEKITLSSAKFKIKDSKGNYVKQKVGSKYYDTFVTNSQGEIGGIDGLVSKNEKGQYVDTSDEEGVVTLPKHLESGEYTLEEIECPIGYVLGKNMKFSVNKNMPRETDEEGKSLITIVYSNTQPKGTINLEKTVSKENTSGADMLVDLDDLSGFAFELSAVETVKSAIDGSVIYQKGEIIDTYYTDEDGKISVENLPLGKYQFVEQICSGYVTNEKVYTFDLVQKDAQTLKYNDKVEVENYSTIYEFSKVDVKDAGLSGAEFEVIDKDGKVIDSWTSKKDETHKIVGLVAGQKYTLVEKTAPSGYVLAKSIEFSVKNTKEVQSQKMTNKYVDMSKKDVGGDEIEGATIQVVDRDGNVVDEWTSGKEKHKIKNLEEGKTYTLKETVTADGYVKATDIEFTVTGADAEGKKEDQHLDMIDKIVTMSKKDVGGDEVEGANIQVVDQDGNVVDEWTSGKEEHKIKNLEEGKTYTLKETVTADGYVKATDIEFTVTGADAEGKKEDQHLDMIDKIVYFKKSDVKDGYVEGAQMNVKTLAGDLVDSWTSGKSNHKIKNLVEGQSYVLSEEIVADGYVKATDIIFTVTGEKENQSITMVDKIVTNKKTTVKGDGLSGAKLEVTDQDGNIVDSWTSDGKDHKINGLKVGEKYTLTETEAPKGYVKAVPVIFYVNEKAEDQAFDLIDKQYTVSKKNVGGDEIEGAKLQVVDQDGNIVDEWISEKNKHAISGLVEGGVYTLKETLVADGYVKATDIDFTVTGADTEGKKEDQHLDMIDKIVTMSKKDVGGDEVEGATIQVVDQDGNVVDEWTSGKEEHKIKNLEEGKTYTLKETVTADGYVKATDIDFTVTGADAEGKKEDQHLDMIDKIVNLLKVDIDEKIVSGALLQVIDEGGNIVDEWTTSEKSHNIEGLVAGKTYTIHEAEAPNGYSKIADTLLVVDDNFENQEINIVDKTTNVYKIDQNNNAVVGAKLEAKVDNKTVDSWTTGDQIVEVSDEVKSDIAENGYAVWETEDAEFKMEANAKSREGMFGNVFDFIFGKSIEDYRLRVIDKNGVSYYNIDIDGLETSHRVSGLSEKDEVTITEENVPEDTENGVGYLKADTQTIVISDSEDTEAKVVDTKYDRVSIKKVDAATNNGLVGAILVLKDADGNVIEKWTSEEKAKTIDKLIVNETYTLEELSAPNGYKIASPITFVVEDNGEDLQEIVMKDDVEVPTGINYHYLAYGITILVAGGCVYIIRKKHR